MRQMISGLVAALAVVAASAVPAAACGLFQGGCSPCGQAYVSPCAQPQVYVAPQPVYSGCNSCGGYRERLPDPVQQYEDAPAPVQQQYYYVDQGPSYSGPGNYAPRPVYREGGYHHRSYYGYGHHHYRPWHAHTGYHYGYAHHGYAPRAYGPRYGYHPHHYGYHGYREHVLRRYY
jgi:hypothetical protein